MAWTETRNLAVDDPEIAWRIMAATAMDQSRLKQEAGIRNTGRKSDKHVLHFALAWHPDQSPTREDMSQAADEAIAALGASDRQAMIIAHDDEKHPHVHIMLNRVSPIDGRHLSSSKEKLRLSEWAQDYEERTGIYCENRIINNAARSNGDYVRGEPDKARHIFEQQQAAASNDNERIESVSAEQRRKDHTLSQRGRNMAEMHKRAQDQLAEAHRQRKSALARDLQRSIAAKRNEVREEYRPQWQKLNQHQRSERETFAELEQTFFGRTSNIVKTVKLSRGDISRDQTGIISRSFRILTNAGARQEYFEKAQERARMALQREQDQKALSAAQELKDAQAVKFQENRAVFEWQRQELQQTQQIERERSQEQWRQRSAERKAAFDRVQPQQEQKPLTRAQKIQAALERSQYQRDFDAARSPKTAEQDNTRQKDTGRTERGEGETGDQSGSTKPRRRRRPRGPRTRNGPDRSR